LLENFSRHNTFHGIMDTSSRDASPNCSPSVTITTYGCRSYHATLLPVSSRIQFILCTLMYDINHGTAPRYLTELVQRCDDSRLRSSMRGNFVVSSK